MFRILVTTLCVGLVSAHAKEFTVESAVDFALKKNPDLKAARFAIEEARGRLMHSGRRPNPELETDLKPNVRGRGEVTLSVGFAQKFPLTKRLLFERQVFEAELKKAEAEVLNAGRLLTSEVRTAAVKLMAAGALKALKETQRKNSLGLSETAEKAAKAGEGSSLDTAMFSLEAKQLTVDLLQAEAEITSLTGSLRPLLGLSPKESVVITTDLATLASVKESSTVSQRPDYKAAIAKEQAARRAVELAKAGKWDDATVGLSAELERSEDAPEGKQTDGFIGFKFSIPLPFWNKNEGKIYEAQASALKASQERGALDLLIRAEVEAARAEMIAANRVIQETSGPLLESAKSLEKAVQNAKAGGQATPADLLRAREKRLAIEASYLNALRDYQLARVRLLAAQGR